MRHEHEPIWWRLLCRVARLGQIGREIWPNLATLLLYSKKHGKSFYQGFTLLFLLISLYFVVLRSGAYSDYLCCISFTLHLFSHLFPVGFGIFVVEFVVVVVGYLWMTNVWFYSSLPTGKSGALMLGQNIND